jgi:hypothetical protein
VKATTTEPPSFGVIWKFFTFALGEHERLDAVIEVTVAPAISSSRLSGYSRCGSRSGRPSARSRGPLVEEERLQRRREVRQPISNQSPGGAHAVLQAVVLLAQVDHLRRRHRVDVALDALLDLLLRDAVLGELLEQVLDALGRDLGLRLERDLALLHRRLDHVARDHAEDAGAQPARALVGGELVDVALSVSA